MMLTLFAMLFYSKAAAARGNLAESRLFGALAVIVVIGQACFLARGAALPNIWDASEYKELFIALGLACFAIDVTIRRRIAD